MTRKIATTDDTRTYTIKNEHRAAYQRTDDQLSTLAGLLEATDMIRLSIESHSALERAFCAINILAREIMTEIWDLRNDEWVSIGGRSNRVPADAVED